MSFLNGLFGKEGSPKMRAQDGKLFVGNTFVGFDVLPAGKELESSQLAMAAELAASKEPVALQMAAAIIKRIGRSS